MKANIVARSLEFLQELARQGLAVVLSALMIMIPLMQGDAFAQSAPPEAAQDAGQQAPQGQPLAAAQLDQLVAPVALYPDALIAQVLAAATYPTQVVEADRWRQAQGNAAPEQIAAGAESHNWDPSVKALTAFPTVLAQMDRNLQWTTDLGNAYYNQPQDVMDAVQAMRQQAQAAGQLRSTPQQVVTNAGGAITIAPANPTVVYVPVYDPWGVYGRPYPVYPGYYYAPPPGVFWGGLAIGFGLGIGIGLFAHWGWGWGHWGIGWQNHAIFYNRAAYFTRSTTVINRGFARPGGPPRNFAARGAYVRPAAGFNRPAGNFGRPSPSYRAAANVPRPGAGYSRPSASYSRPSVAAARPSGSVNRSAMASSRPNNAPRAVAGAAVSRGSGAPSGSNRPSGGSRPSAGHSSGGSHSSSGGHGGHEEHGR